MKKILFLLFLFIISQAKAQISLKDSSAFAGLISVSYSFQFSGGDLADRYGNNSALGASFSFKTRSNWIIGVDFNYIFGNEVKVYDQIIKNIATSEGYVISREGTFTDTKMFERGFYTAFKLGKIIPVLNTNPNSGLLLLGSVGYLQHGIRIEVDNNNTPQLMGDYARGYDRLSSGLAISEFVGFIHLSDKRLTNFYAGFEFTQGWTKSMRDYDFVMMKKDNNIYKDSFFGIKIGWIFPLYQRSPEKFYYN
ncbi:MAG: hypothetical protein NTZ33_15805 [Bacteroidetes bacterium]|nr:hypothetical protein [Bacteroidota bacterium]